MKYIDHLKELRKRILLSFFILIISFCFFIYNASFVGEILTKPLFDLFDDSDKKRMIFTALPEVFVSNLKIALFASFLTSFPFLISQIILFIYPALYKKEKKIIIPTFSLIPILFICGVCFAYFFLIPIIWNFFISFENFLQGSIPVVLESKYSEYMKLTMYLLFASGLSFEFPVLLFILSKLGVVSYETLKKKRKYFFIGIVIFSAILTPPDVISQIGIAIPLIIFYEFSLLLIKLTKKNN
ncbi:MAG: twin-arginine translocase subunit TatC [Alphaproteobacteria bacterium]